MQMEKVSLTDFIAELGKLGIPLWIWIAMAFPILGAIMVVGLVFLRSD